MGFPEGTKRVFVVRTQAKLEQPIATRIDLVTDMSHAQNMNHMQTQAEPRADHHAEQHSKFIVKTYV